MWNESAKKKNNFQFFERFHLAENYAMTFQLTWSWSSYNVLFPLCYRLKIYFYLTFTAVCMKRRPISRGELKIKFGFVFRPLSGNSSNLVLNNIFENFSQFCIIIVNLKKKYQAIKILQLIRGSKNDTSVKYRTIRVMVNEFIKFVLDSFY